MEFFVTQKIFAELLIKFLRMCKLKMPVQKFIRIVINKC